MKKFAQLSHQERGKIYRGLCSGKTKEAIAKELGRTKSTITREVARNSDAIGYLYPDAAHENALRRKHKNKPKISGNQDLKEYIIERLNRRWSPGMISGRYKLENSGQTISTEAIYQWIYSNGGKELGLRKLLVRAHKKRGFKRKVRKSKIKNRVSVHSRPDHINERLEPGHFECDLIFNQGSQSKNICTLTDRLTREAIMIKNKSKHTTIVIDAIVKHIAKNKLNVKSVTFDNGGEFAEHVKLNPMGIETYFCDPGCPWQKGSIENFNGMARRFLPFTMSANEITEDFVKTVNREINNMPRAILGFRTPSEFLNQHRESRMKIAQPATEVVDNVKQFDVVFNY